MYNEAITKEERKEARRVSANESKMWDCLNEAVDKIGNDSTDSEIKKEALNIYKEKGFSSLPFLNRQKVFKSYFS